MQVSDDETVLPLSSVGGEETEAAAATSSSNNSADGWLGPVKKSKKRNPKQQGQDNPPLLPLDWTRVKRRRSNNDDNAEDEDCCPPVVPTLDEQSLKPHQELVQGLGVMCLHDSDPSWFQGYFFPNVYRPNDNNDEDDSNEEQDWIQKHQQKNNNQNTKPWGLLATQDEDLDDCLRCADGGYRRLNLTVFPFPHKQRKETLVNIEWTGGDMMRLQGERANLEPAQMRTGKRAVPIVEALFGSLIRKCRQNLSEDEKSSAEVLDLLPDVVVISGPMKLVMTKTQQEQDLFDD